MTFPECSKRAAREPRAPRPRGSSPRRRLRRRHTHRPRRARRPATARPYPSPSCCRLLQTTTRRFPIAPHDLLIFVRRQRLHCLRAGTRQTILAVNSLILSRKLFILLMYCQQNLLAQNLSTLSVNDSNSLFTVANFLHFLVCIQYDMIVRINEL